MPRPRDVLQRFRYAGAPGSAAGGGVPADRAAEAAAELEPLLRLLDPAQEEARRLRDSGVREAGDVRRRAEDEAEQRASAARAAAAAVRAQAAADVVRRAADHEAEVRGAAEREARLVREVAAARMPEYVDRVVAAVVSSITGGEP